MREDAANETPDHTRLRAVLDSAVDGIISIDEHGIVNAMNPAAEELFGYSASEVVGRNVKMLMPVPFRDEHDHYISNYRRTGERKIIGIGREVEGLRKDGSVFPLYLSVSEVRLGESRSFTGILHDLSALRQAEAEVTKLGRILETSLNEIYIFEAKSLKFLFANHGALLNLGYSTSEIAQLTPVDLKPEFSHPEFRKMLQPLESGRETLLQFETVHCRKNGSHYPVFVHLQHTRWNLKNAFVATILDLTAQKHAEEELKRRSAQVKSLVEHLPAAAAYFDIASENVHFNRIIERITGYSAEQLSTLEQCNQLLFGSDAEHVRSACQSLDGTADGNEVRLRLSIRRLDGVPRVVEFHGYRYDDHEVWLLLDITERDRHDTELRIRNQAIQSASEGIVIADARMSGFPIVFVNRAFESMSGFRSDEALGCGCEMLCGNAGTKSIAQLKAAVAELTETSLTIKCCRKDGTSYWNEISVAPVHSAEHEVSHLVAVMKDVTERREAHERKLQSERLAAIGQMVTGLAHESRNALQRAQACLDMLALDLEDSPEQLELTTRTHRALNDLHRYYEEVQNYAAPMNLELHSVDLGRLLRATWDDLEAVWFGRTFELKIHLPHDGLTCRIDDHRMRQVFRNIMENALAACDDPGQLSIQCKRGKRSAGDVVQIVFEDNGPGLTADTKKRIFQPFYTTKQKGTGLGLAIARRIIEAHHGTLEVGESDDDGARFVLTLPQ